MKKNEITKSIDHMVITTADLEACLHFYEGLLGMEHKIEGGQHALHFERYGARGLMDSIYMYDPDGNLVEIAVYKPVEDIDEPDDIHDPCLRFQR